MSLLKLRERPALLLALLAVGAKAYFKPELIGGDTIVWAAG
jgi:hypothetical protein